MYNNSGGFVGILCVYHRLSVSRQVSVAGTYPSVLLRDNRLAEAVESEMDAEMAEQCGDVFCNCTTGCEYVIYAGKEYRGVSSDRHGNVRQVTPRSK